MEYIIKKSAALTSKFCFRETSKFAFRENPFLAKVMQTSFSYLCLKIQQEFYTYEILSSTLMSFLIPAQNYLCQ